MLIIGHRGACGYEPENTLRSFKKALDMGVDAIELDVYVSRDGKVVIMHDDKIDRTTNGKGFVFDKTYDELEKYDAGMGEKIPRLEDVFNLINRKVPINVELKGEGTAKPVAKLIEDYVKKKKWSYDDFIISSFNHLELQKFHKMCPKVKIGALFSGIPVIGKLIGDVKLDYVNDLKKIMNISYLNTNMDSVNKKLVDYAHKNKLKVLIYTVNDLDDMKRMKKMDVDGIFTNFPDRAAKI